MPAFSYRCQLLRAALKSDSSHIEGLRKGLKRTIRDLFYHTVRYQSFYFLIRNKIIRFRNLSFISLRHFVIPGTPLFRGLWNAIPLIQSMKFQEWHFMGFPPLYNQHGFLYIYRLQKRHYYEGLATRGHEVQRKYAGSWWGF